MKRDAVATVGAWALLASGVALLGASALTRPGRSPVTTGMPTASPSQAVAAPYAAESLAVVTVGHDLFRSDRRAPDVVYDAARSVMPPVAAPFRPVLLLSGIVWGTAPEAVIDGLPGVDGPRVMRAGDQVAGLKVERIERADVVIVGMDTTWTLRVREPWR